MSRNLEFKKILSYILEKFFLTVKKKVNAKHEYDG